MTPGAGNHALVTGCAGFLGSHLCERLIDEGREVVGLDCFTTYYSRRTKERNVERLRDEPHFRLVELDLSSEPLCGLLDGVDVIFHLAARAGVRGSFGESFREYVRDNVVATGCSPSCTRPPPRSTAIAAGIPPSRYRSGDPSRRTG
jgi:nucleoside-diphosphate-sugar epimerase